MIERAARSQGSNGRTYTFHSFYLECLAFLATWFVIDAAFAALSAMGSMARRST
jgi:hypothetical protein